MSLLTLRPNAAGTGTGNAQHTPVGDTPNYKCCDEAVADDDTTYIENLSDISSVTVFTKTDRYNLEDPIVGGGTPSGPINSVTIYMRSRCSANIGTHKSGTHIRTNNANHNDTLVTVGLTYTNANKAYTSNPQTLIAWLWTEITALQAGCQTQVAGDDVSSTSVRNTITYVEVDYKEAIDPPALSLSLALQSQQITGSGTATLTASTSLSLAILNNFSLVVADIIAPPAVILTLAILNNFSIVVGSQPIQVIYRDTFALTKNVTDSFDYLRILRDDTFALTKNVTDSFDYLRILRDDTFILQSSTVSETFEI